MQSQIAELESQLQSEQRRTRAVKIYKAVDPEGTNSVSYKTLVAKLSGFAKFDLDTKIDCYQFYKLLEAMGSEPVDDEEQRDEQAEDAPVEMHVSAEKFDKVCAHWEQSVCGEAAAPAFAGDLENEQYKAMVQAMRDFSPEAHVEQK